MAQEIERKFLVRSDAWRAGVTRRHRIRQAYLSVPGSRASVRIRVVDEQTARLTVKAAAGSDGPALSRAEFEYPVPLSDALAMFELRVGEVVEKVRHVLDAGAGRVWEVDEFSGGLAGLVMAEIELARADEDIALPGWVGREVTNDPRYGNVALAQGAPTRSA